VAGEDLSGEQLHEVVNAVRRDIPVPPETAIAPETIVVTSSADHMRSVVPAEVGPAGAGEASRVRCLAVYAKVANWDADKELDGLLVHVYPLDVNGAVVPARGTLEIDLLGQRFGRVKRSRPFTSLGRWTQQVSRADFGSDGAVYRLTFQRVHPELDLSVAPYAAIHAKLSVSGQGTFETIESTVRIRPYVAALD